jgi:hypothetical protein
MGLLGLHGCMDGVADRWFLLHTLPQDGMQYSCLHKKTPEFFSAIRKVHSSGR